jgi:hypothetical protein
MQLVTLSLKSLGEMEERDAGTIDAASRLINTLPSDAAINSYGAAAFVELPPGAGHQLGYLALETNRSSPQLQAARLVFGNGPDGGEAPVYESDSGLNGGNDLVSSFFSTGNAMYALASSEVVSVDGGVDGGEALLTAQDDLSSPGVAARLLPPIDIPDGGLAGVVGLHGSSVVAGDVVVLGARAPGISGPFTLFSGRVPVNKLNGLAPGDPHYFTTRVLDMLLVGGKSASAWGRSDDVVIVGSSGGADISLMWLDTTELHVLASGSIPLQMMGGTLSGTAVMFDSPGPVGPAGAVFDIAWTESFGTQNTAGAYRNLYYAQLTCTTRVDAGQ